MSHFELLPSSAPVGQTTFGPGAARAAEPLLTWLSFPGGERHVRVAELPALRGPSGAALGWTLRADIDDAQGVVDLMLVADALRRRTGGDTPLTLWLPYVPYARQDRATLAGEAFSAQVFCQLVNMLDFDEVVIADPHSAVVVGCLQKVRVLTVAELLIPLLAQSRHRALLFDAVLVAPDAGALPRTLAFASALQAYRREHGSSAPVQVLQALKHRNPQTGMLSAPRLAPEQAPCVLESVKAGHPLLVVDDICDGGGTFMQLATTLREHTQAPLYLYVSHGIFSKGVAGLHEQFDAVFCAFPFAKVAADLDNGVSERGVGGVRRAR